MKCSNPTYDLVSFFQILFSPLHLKKSPPNPILRFQTTLASSEVQHPTAPYSSLSGFRVQKNYGYIYLNSNSSASIQCSHSGFISSQPQDALSVLDNFPQPINPLSGNISNLTSALRTFSQSCQFGSAVRTFNLIRSTGFWPDQFAYVNVIWACTAVQKFTFGDQFLSLVVKVGLLSNGYILSGLIDLFSKGGSFLKALDAFLYTYIDNVVCWNAIIAGAVRDGKYLIALKLFHQMVEGFCIPNGFTFSSVLSACAAIGEPDIGREMHALVLKFNEQDDIFVGTSLIDLYAKYGDLDAAVKVFSSMPVRNVVSWTALISGFVQEEDGVSTLKYFTEMRRNNMDINVCTITSVLFACRRCLMEDTSYQIHCLILKSGLYTDSVAREALITAYGTIGNVQMSEKLFLEEGTGIQLKNWSAMISSLIQNGYIGRSIELFLQLLSENLKPDKSCISSILSIVDLVSFGEQLHTYVVKVGLIDDLLVCSSLFTMYSKGGSIPDSYELFGQMPEKDRVSWTSMISGFATHGNAEEALLLFREMVFECIEPDEMTISGALTACIGPTFLKKGKEIHGFSFRHGFNSDTVIGSSLLLMYSKCNNIESVEKVFNHIKCKDQVLWSCLISAYSTNNTSEKAIFSFHQMVTTGYKIDHIICSSVLGACAQLSRPVLGRQLHGYATKAGIVLYNSVVSAMITLYAKCGNIFESRKLFDGMQNPDLVTWTAMIEGCAQHGMAKEALETFDVMQNNGMKPDAITFVIILSACSHNGLVDEGFSYFKSMSSNYGIEPEMRHYSCMVDLLGRAGRLKEAVDFIDRMPSEPGMMVWSTLLGACRVHGDVEIGCIARNKVLDLETHESGTHIAASNMSADMGDWEQVSRIRNSMKGSGLKKEAGWSTL